MEDEKNLMLLCQGAATWLQRLKVARCGGKAISSKNTSNMLLDFDSLVGYLQKKMVKVVSE